MRASAPGLMRDAVVALIVVLAACQSTAPSASPNGVRIEQAAEDGAVASLVSAAAARASHERRRVLVYVGATWCPPCKEFHRAATTGLLDRAFPATTFLEFDADRDADRLIAAGYTSDFLPLFVVPKPDGTASARRIEGAQKGGDYVRDIAARLGPLLDRR